MRTQVLLYGILASVLIYTSLHSPSLFSNRFLKNAGRVPAAENATYEAITGQSADEDRSVWDTFYQHKNFVFGKDPVSFLKDYLHRVPVGKAFVPAMGEGRNAIYLAKNGFQVDGNDLSEVAVDRALSEARDEKVTFKPIVADLTQYPLAPDAYDFVLVSLFYKPSLVDAFKKTVKKGGYIMLYLRIQDDSRFDRISPDDFAVKPAEVKNAFKDFKTVVYREYTDHGIPVLGLLAQKP